MVQDLCISDLNQVRIERKSIAPYTSADQSCGRKCCISHLRHCVATCFFHCFFHLWVINGVVSNYWVRMDIIGLFPLSFELSQYPRGSSQGLFFSSPAKSRELESLILTGPFQLKIILWLLWFWFLSPPLHSAITVVDTQLQSKAQRVPEIIPSYSIIHELFSGKLAEKIGKTNLIIIS